MLGEGVRREHINNHAVMYSTCRKRRREEIRMVLVLEERSVCFSVMITRGLRSGPSGTRRRSKAGFVQCEWSEIFRKHLH